MERSPFYNLAILTLGEWLTWSMIVAEAANNTSDTYVMTTEHSEAGFLKTVWLIFLFESIYICILCVFHVVVLNEMK